MIFFHFIAVGLCFLFFTHCSCFSKNHSEDYKKVVNLFYQAILKKDQKLMDEISLTPTRFNFLGDVGQWRIIYKEKITNKNQLKALVVAEETNSHDIRPQITVFHLLMSKNRWKIEGHYSIFPGEDPESTFPYVELDDNEMRTSCTNDQLERIYFDLLEAIKKSDKSKMANLLKHVAYSKPLKYMVGLYDGELTMEDFIREVLSSGTLLHDFVFSSDRLRNYFSDKPIERYYDFYRRQYIRVNLTKTLKALHDWSPDLSEPDIQIAIHQISSGVFYSQSDISLSKNRAFTIEVLAPPKFLCTINGWKMTHFFSKWSGDNWR